jgi:hypothetical protein
MLLRTRAVSDLPLWPLAVIEKSFPERAIIGFHRDEENHWVADLDCGHTRHVRHDPPWQNREWVKSLVSRRERIGFILECKKCSDVAGEPKI